MVSIDDKLLFRNSANPQLVFAQADTSGTVLWGPLFEKAWAKIKGSFATSAGGLLDTGLASFVGVPIFRYDTATITNEA